MNSTWIASRAASVQLLKQHEFRGLQDLHGAHKSLLQHLAKSGIIAGFEYWWNEDVLELEAWGLVKGEWIGSLDHDAHPFWSITDTGRKVIE